MKKSVQIAMNDTVTNFIDRYNAKFTRCGNYEQLDSCQAWVFQIIDGSTGEFVGYGLVSYNTFVAAVVYGEFYDFLRYVYCYTATSAKHISKFRNRFPHEHEFTYRPI